MKKLASAFLLFMATLALSGCEDNAQGNVAFFVGNAGTARKWDHITVTVGNQTGSFMTPEGSNMTLSSCDGAYNSTSFSLPPGRYSYEASSSIAQWSGTVTVEGGDCKIIQLQY